MFNQRPYNKQFFLLTIVSLYLSLCASALAGPVSHLKSDETLVFFNTSAWLDEQSKSWHIPIHGWIYEPEKSIIRKTAIEKTLQITHKLTVTAQNRRQFDRRVNALLADNERGKKIIIRLADRTYALPTSQANGHFKHILKIKAEHLNTTEHPLISFQAVLPPNDKRQFFGQVKLVKPTGLSIISDIDDTIKISGVTDRRTLLDNTFYQPFKAVPGMAAMYQQWLSTDGALHFVSSSPWQLYPELHEFIDSAGFPVADYALKSFRFKDKTLMNLLAKSTETKPPQITEILTRYPNRRFILVGDSGEYDPEIYAQIQKKYPTQIQLILIRNVTEERVDNKRFQALFKHLEPHQWQLFRNTEEIKYTTR